MHAGLSMLMHLGVRFASLSIAAHIPIQPQLMRMTRAGNAARRRQPDGDRVVRGANEAGSKEIQVRAWDK